jgi:hypothetical protein
VSTTFDLAALARAIEARDAEAQRAAYADDAEVQIVDRVNMPRAPRVLRGRDEIGAWIDDVCGRDMTHRVEAQVLAADGAAFTERCLYPDGTTVLVSVVLELRDGRIGRQTVVQAWDE